MEYKDYELIKYSEFEELQKDFLLKIEYDNGYVVYMSPVKPDHDRVKNKIAYELINHLGFWE